VSKVSISDIEKINIFGVTHADNSNHSSTSCHAQILQNVSSTRTALCSCQPAAGLLIANDQRHVMERGGEGRRGQGTATMPTASSGSSSSCNTAAEEVSMLCSVREVGTARTRKDTVSMVSEYTVRGWALRRPRYCLEIPPGIGLGLRDWLHPEVAHSSVGRHNGFIWTGAI
jgi:hypothetical protein